MTSRIEWLKWMMRYGRPKIRARQARLFLAFELYYQLCRLRGYRVTHFLEGWGQPVPEGTRPREGKYILVWPRLPLSMRLLDRIFPFGRDAHAEYILYTPEAAEEVRKTGRRVEVIDIWCELRFMGSDD